MLFGVSRPDTVIDVTRIAVLLSHYYGAQPIAVHVARGGDHTSPVEGLRVAARTFEEDWWRSGDPQFPKSIWWLPEMDFIGCRVAMSIEADDQKSDK